ncbi:MAG: DUF4249 family protein [Calditrichaeota bacterium]|nr:MAG: DUF4249 family protein [Calditrichota bacterium]
MRQIILFFLSILALVLWGCEENSPLVPESQQVVVRAYIYANEPVDDIQLTTTYSITSEDTVGAPLNDATISLVKNGQTYALVPSAGDSGYYHYPGDDLQVDVGDEFEIVVEHNGETITGKTMVPSPPVDVAISKDVYTIDTSAFGFRGDTSSVTVSWNQEDEDTFYFIVVENIEAELVYIDERFGDMLRGIRRFRSHPIKDDEYQIQRFDLTFQGMHDVRVYKVNQEYADLYEFGLQDSRNLNEPKSNIQNGLGVFAGFSSATVQFTVSVTE